MKLNKNKLTFNECSAKIFSQNSEDGILMYIYSKIGFGDKVSLEIGVNTGSYKIEGGGEEIPEGNSINLITNFGFFGVLVDMDLIEIRKMEYFFAKHFATKHFHLPDEELNSHVNQSIVNKRYYSPVLIQEKVDELNVIEILKIFEHKGVKKLDLLSIDIDGNDLSVFKCINRTIKTRVLVIEFNSRIISYEPYFAGKSPDDNFEKSSIKFQSSYGSNLAMTIKEISSEGYTFIGVEPSNFNAFFLINDEFEKNPFFDTPKLENVLESLNFPPLSTGI
jgi:hypothetical protein